MRARVFGVCGSTSAMQEDVLFCAWSKNTAVNSNYDLRGAGECVFTPGTRTQPATAITACVVLVNVVWYLLLRKLSARDCDRCGAG